MLSNEPACWWTTETGSEALLAICRLNLDAEGAKDIDAEQSSRLAVLVVSRHRSRNLRVDQPMAALDIVIVTARTDALDDEGLDGLDCGKAVYRGHDESIQLKSGRRRRHNEGTGEWKGGSKTWALLMGEAWLYADDGRACLPRHTSE